ncbi:MAG TPA: LysR family transcriptional regulator [Candidatus Saccharimonadales bacterium]|nr:LysR family transcriptional regulator [Candidatus Saccharimonadales bacterium]
MEDRLKKFATLIDAGSFTKAARELHISQPALSAAIAKLERELKITLLVRGSRPLMATKAGTLAYATAKDMRVVTDNLALKLHELQNTDITLAVGMIDSVADILFDTSTLLESLEKRAHLSLVVNNSRYLLGALERGKLDAAFVVERAVNRSATIEYLPIARDPQVLVCQPAMAATAAAAISAGEPIDFISYDPPSTTAQLIASSLESRGISVRPVFSSTSPEVMLRLLCLGRGISVLSYLTVRSLVMDGTLQILTQNGKPVVIERPVALAKRRDKELAAPLTRIMAHVQRELQYLAAEAATPLGGPEQSNVPKRRIAAER